MALFPTTRRASNHGLRSLVDRSAPLSYIAPCPIPPDPVLMTGASFVLRHIRTAILLLGLLVAGCDTGDRDPATPAESFEQALASYQEGALAAARPLFVQAEQLARAQNRRDILLQTIVYQARLARDLGELKVAAARASEGALLAKQLGDFRAEASLRTLEGNVYADAGIRPAALRALGDAQRLSATFNDQTTIADAELALGDLWLQASNPVAAEDHFQRAFTAAQTASNHSSAALALSGIAEIFRLGGKSAEALNSVTQAIGLVDRSDDPVVAARLRLRLGRIHESNGNQNAALTAYRDGVNILRRERAGRRLEVQLLFRIGALYASNKRGGDARKYFGDGLEIARREGDKVAQYYLNLLVLRTDVGLMESDQRVKMRPRIIQAYSQLAAQFREILQKPGEAAAAGYVGDEMRASGDVAGASRWYATAAAADRERFLAFADPLLHQPFLEYLGVARHQSHWASALAGMLARENRVLDALTILEQHRQSELADALDGLELTLRHPTLKTKAAAVRADMFQLRLDATELSARLGSGIPDPSLVQARSELFRRLQALRSRAAAISAQYANYGAIVRADTVFMAGIQKFIPRGTTVMQHVGDGAVVHIITLNRDRHSVHTVQTAEATVRSLAQEYLRLMQDPLVYTGEGGEESVTPMTRFATVSTELYDLLVRPAENEIGRGLVVVGSDIIGDLPVHALEKQDRSGRIEYLVEYMSVDYISGWTALQFPTRPANKLRDIVAFGNPSGKNWSVDYELRDIRSFFRGADVYIGRDATWDHLKSVRADLLQIASDFRTGLTGFGVLMMSEGQATDETMEVPFEQLLQLEPSPVVVLTNQLGEGMGLGTSHAMLLRINATSDVFLNAWGADRKSGKLFSEFFFTHLANGLAPGDAYRQALLNLISTREVSHPRSWAQFFHFGVG